MLECNFLSKPAPPARLPRRPLRARPRYRGDVEFLNFVGATEGVRPANSYAFLLALSLVLGKCAGHRVLIAARFSGFAPRGKSLRRRWTDPPPAANRSRRNRALKYKGAMLYVDAGRQLDLRLSRIPSGPTRADFEVARGWPRGDTTNFTLCSLNYSGSPRSRLQRHGRLSLRRDGLSSPRFVAQSATAAQSAQALFGPP